MFIEKLKKEQISEFAARFDCSVAELKKDDECIYVKFFTGSYGPQPEFWLTDFECKASEYFSKMENSVQKQWRNFLYNKFGEQYKNKLADNFNNELNELSKW